MAGEGLRTILSTVLGAIGNRTVIVLAVGALTLGCAGCGGSASGSRLAVQGRPVALASMTPDAIVAEAKRALLRASTVVVDGTVYVGGYTVHWEMVLTKRGDEGTFSTGKWRYNVVRLGKDIYVEASAATWKRFGSAAFGKRYGGIWVEGPITNRSLASYGSLLNRAKLFSATSTSKNPWRKGPQTSVNGHEEVTLTNKEVTLYVAARGTPFPLELIQHGHRAGLVIDDYRRRFSVVSPRAFEKRCGGLAREDGEPHVRAEQCRKRVAEAPKQS